MIKKTTSINQDSVRNFDQTDSKCVCQICTCHSHRCPHANIHIPFQQITSYQKEYVPHPLNQTPHMCTDNTKYSYKPYDYLNSSYREDFPGHKPRMRQKIIPRVKNQNTQTKFAGQSWYKSTYQPKSVQKDKLRNKDKQFNPDFQPFMASTTYKQSFYPKRPQSQLMNSPSEINYPKGYKFSSETTYFKDFIQKSVSSVPNFKPLEKVAPKGKHYLNSTYRDDFNKKQNISLCPILTLPRYPQQKSHPKSHLYLDRTSGVWQQK